MVNGVLLSSGTSCFQGFFNYPEMQIISTHFCVYHMNALGQQEGAPSLPNGYLSMFRAIGICKLAIGFFEMNFLVSAKYDIPQFHD